MIRNYRFSYGGLDRNTGIIFQLLNESKHSRLTLSIRSTQGFVVCRMHRQTFFLIPLTLLPLVFRCFCQVVDTGTVSTFCPPSLCLLVLLGFSASQAIHQIQWDSLEHLVLLRWVWDYNTCKLGWSCFLSYKVEMRWWYLSGRTVFSALSSPSS